MDHRRSRAEQLAVDQEPLFPYLMPELFGRPGLFDHVVTDFYDGLDEVLPLTRKLSSTGASSKSQGTIVSSSESESACGTDAGQRVNDVSASSALPTGGQPSCEPVVPEKASATLPEDEKTSATLPEYEKTSATLPEYENTTLLMAAQEGHLGRVLALCDEGAAVNQAAEDGATPLFMAAKQGHVDCVRALCDAGAAVNQPAQGGIMPLSVAMREGHVECATVLSSHGAARKKHASSSRPACDVDL